MILYTLYTIYTFIKNSIVASSGVITPGEARSQHGTTVPSTSLNLECFNIHIYMGIYIAIYIFTRFYIHLFTNIIICRLVCGHNPRWSEVPARNNRAFHLTPPGVPQNTYKHDFIYIYALILDFFLPLRSN